MTKSCFIKGLDAPLMLGLKALLRKLACHVSLIFRLRYLLFCELRQPLTVMQRQEVIAYIALPLANSKSFKWKSI